MKIKLLNDGGYGDMDNVNFPVVVEGVDWGGYGFDVKGSEIIKVTGDAEGWDCDADYFWENDEVEVIHES